MHESAGRQTPAGKRHGNKWLTAMLVAAAGAVGRMQGKNYLSAQHARLTRRRGMGRAQIAVAHSMLVSASDGVIGQPDCAPPGEYCRGIHLRARTGASSWLLPRMRAGLARGGG